MTTAKELRLAAEKAKNEALDEDCPKKYNDFDNNNQYLFAVTALLFKNNKILSVSRKDNHKDLGLPGGKVEKCETPEQALIRELFEETGIVAKTYYPIFERFDETSSKICRTYFVETFEGKAVCKEKAWVGWVSPQRLMKPNCSFHKYNIKLFAEILKFI